MDLILNFFLSEERQQVRKDICESCEHKIKITNICGKCGCFIPAKITLVPANCPIGLWPIETVEIPGVQIEVPDNTDQESTRP
jgi:hypothetical protein